MTDGTTSQTPARSPAAEPAPWDLDVIADGLRLARERWRLAHHRNVEIGVQGFPSRARVDAIVADLCAALFPQLSGVRSRETD